MRCQGLSLTLLDGWMSSSTGFERVDQAASVGPRAAGAQTSHHHATHYGSHSACASPVSRTPRSHVQGWSSRENPNFSNSATQFSSSKGTNTTLAIIQYLIQIAYCPSFSLVHSSEFLAPKNISSIYTISENTFRIPLNEN